MEERNLIILFDDFHIDEEEWNKNKTLSFIATHSRNRYHKFIALSNEKRKTDNLREKVNNNHRSTIKDLKEVGRVDWEYENWKF